MLLRIIFAHKMQRTKLYKAIIYELLHVVKNFRDSQTAIKNQTAIEKQTAIKNPTGEISFSQKIFFEKKL